MLFLLTTLNIAHEISTPILEDKEDETVEEMRKKNKWDNDDFICRGHILNGMVDSLFDVYQNVESAKELWNILEGKYMAQDATRKKFHLSSFNDYKFVDSHPIMDQFHEIQSIYSNLKRYNIKMDEVFVVSSIIEKLPYSWRDFKKTLQHKEEDIDVNELDTHLQIEVSIRAQESGDLKIQISHPLTWLRKVPIKGESGKANMAIHPKRVKPQRPHHPTSLVRFVESWDTKRRTVTSTRV